MIDKYGHNEKLSDLSLVANCIKLISIPSSQKDFEKSVRQKIANR